MLSNSVKVTRKDFSQAADPERSRPATPSTLRASALVSHRHEAQEILFYIGSAWVHNACRGDRQLPRARPAVGGQARTLCRSVAAGTPRARGASLPRADDQRTRAGVQPVTVRAVPLLPQQEIGRAH